MAVIFSSIETSVPTISMIDLSSSPRNGLDAGRIENLNLQ